MVAFRYISETRNVARLVFDAVSVFTNYSAFLTHYILEQCNSVLASTNDVVIPIDGLPDISTVKETSLCKFGSLIMRRGESVGTDEKCLECTCRHPPMIECIRVEDCA